MVFMNAGGRFGFVSDALLEAGAASVDVTDADAGSPAEQPVFAEPGAEPPRPWQQPVSRPPE